MPVGKFDIYYAETMQRRAAGHTVGYIATFDLHTCTDSDDAFRVFDDTNVEIYDQIPVRKNGRIVGVLERREAKSKESG